MSIRRRMLFWLLSSVLAGGLVAAVVVFYQARAEVNEIFDYQLRQLALTLRDRVFFPTDLAALQGEESLDVVLQVWGPDGRLLYASRPGLEIPGSVQIGFSQVQAHGARWRVYATQQRGLTIGVAQPLALRDALAFTAAWRTLMPFLVALPLMGFLIWRLVGRELQPLESTAEAVARRSAESLEPLDAAAVPEEIQPLALALNGLLARLGTALGQQRQFIADAAHELRTPLTALKLQLQLAERARDDAERAKAHGTLREGIARATHLVEQLLTLARQDPDAPIEAAASIDLAELARMTAEGHEPVATEKGLSLAVDAPSPVLVAGDRASLRSLIDNLLDNAMRYTSVGGVKLRVAREGDNAILEVEDTGPGIPSSERERVFHRFYRGESAAEGGSGLGLAIVQRIAQRHRGQVDLLEGAGARGLRVRVTLPGK